QGSTAATAIPLERAVRYASSPAELQFVLESFAALREAGVDGAYQLLRDATRGGRGGRNSWRGAVWQLEVIRSVIGLEHVRGVEVKFAGREVDILLIDGTRVEVKDWSDWNASSFERQFAVDLEG